MEQRKSRAKRLLHETTFTAASLTNFHCLLSYPSHSTKKYLFLSSIFCINIDEATHSPPPRWFQEWITSSSLPYTSYIERIRELDKVVVSGSVLGEWKSDAHTKRSFTNELLNRFTKRKQYKAMSTNHHGKSESEATWGDYGSNTDATLTKLKYMHNTEEFFKLYNEQHAIAGHRGRNFGGCNWMNIFIPHFHF